MSELESLTICREPKDTAEIYTQCGAWLPAEETFGTECDTKLEQKLKEVIDFVSSRVL